MFLELPGSTLVEIESICGMKRDRCYIFSMVDCANGAFRSEYDTYEKADEAFQVIVNNLEKDFPNRFFLTPDENKILINREKVKAVQYNGSNPYAVSIFTPFPGGFFQAKFDSASDAKQFYEKLSNELKGTIIV